jgi:MEMO1 family protein
MSIVHTSLFCHAPIVVPAVGGRRGEASARTTAAMAVLAREVVASAPDVVIVVSPHTPRIAGALPLLARGVDADFGDFRADVRFSLPGIVDEAGLIGAARDVGVALEPIRVRRLDHGAAVPLFFLHEAGWRGPTVVIGLPHPDDAAGPGDSLAIDEALGRALRAWGHGLRAALVCSGDGSHRLTADAPAGFHPDAATFDRAMLALLQRGDDAGVRTLDPALRDVAGEDIVDSVVVGGSAARHARGRRVLSHEHPFGVGYTVAVLDDAGDHPHALAAPRPALLMLARASLAAALRGDAPPALPDDDDDSDDDAWGVMVSWHRRDDGALRGCLGHVPRRTGLAATVREMAVAAATRDPRFAPVTVDELDDLVATVTLVGRPEAIDAVDDAHDPDVFGLTVRAGTRQGLLLPDLAGVDTAAWQLRITLEKARIAPGEPVFLHRFRARSLTEARP